MSIQIDPTLGAMFIRSSAQLDVLTDLIVEIYSKLFEKDPDEMFHKVIENINEKALELAKSLPSFEEG